MMETAAAAAGGSAGGIAGKKVSDGMTKIFGKIDKTAAKAAKSTTEAPRPRLPISDGTTPLLEVGPATVKSDGSNVPPPPPIRRAGVRKAAPPPERVVAPVVEPAPVIPPPPVPEVTADDLKGVTAGMRRDDVLRLGAPAARITMSDDGHLIEIYRYQVRETTVGVVRLTDGAVSNVAIR